MAAHPDIAFEDLLRELRQEGFALSPNDYIEVTAIFNQFTGTREEFKYHIAPIICRNRDEQATFYRIYDAHTSLAGRLNRRHNQRSQDSPAPIPTEFINAFMRLAAKRYYAWLLLVLAISVAIRIFSLLHQKHIIGPVYAEQPDTIEKYGNPKPEWHPHGRVFVAKAYKHVVPDTPELTSRIMPRGQPMEKVNTVTSTTFARLLVLGLAGLALSLSVFPLRRSNLLPNLDLDKTIGDDAPIDIPFESKDQLIQNLPVLARIARDLVQPVPTDVYRLDINSTIRESIKAYGLLTPVNVNVHRRPEYLMLIDDSHPIRAHLLRHLAQTLSRLSVPLDYYFYAKREDAFYPEDAVTSINRAATPINTYTLKQRHGDAIVITPDGDLSVIDSFIDPTGQPIPEPLRAAFDFGPTLFLPTPAAAREYLDDEDLFQWLCALAIYPTVQWEVLLSVGAAVLQQRNALHKLNVANLLRLTRIDWLGEKTIPTNIRLELLRQLGLHEEVIARQTILELLKESDALMNADDDDAANAAAHAQIKLLSQTQSFILYAYNTRANKRYETDARHFMSHWDRRRIPDMATVLYLQNKDHKWATPVRSPDDPTQSVDANRFINELLALRVIHNPWLRAFFRNLGYSFFFILALLWLFKDPIQPLQINSTLGLIGHDYPTRSQPLTIRIPVNACLKNMLSGSKLLVTLVNYDNNLYSQLLTLDARDTLTARMDTLNITFTDITMANKPADSPAFRILFNKSLSIANTSTQYYPTYILDTRGDDCEVILPPIAPVRTPPPPNSVQQ